MSVITITTKELQKNFEKYINLLMSGQEIILTKNDKEIGRLIPKGSGSSCLTDSLTGIIKGNYDLDDEKKTGLQAKYDLND